MDGGYKGSFNFCILKYIKHCPRIYSNIIKSCLDKFVCLIFFIIWEPEKNQNQTLRWIFNVLIGNPKISPLFEKNFWKQNKFLLNVNNFISINCKMHFYYKISWFLFLVKIVEKMFSNWGMFSIWQGVKNVLNILTISLRGKAEAFTKSGSRARVVFHTYFFHFSVKLHVQTLENALQLHGQNWADKLT